MSETIEIGRLNVEPGSKISGSLKAGERVIDDIDIPITVVNGASPGPTLCVTAGIHGCEYPGIEAAIRLGKNTDPAKLGGKLVIIPVLNLSSFVSRTPYINPIDGINMNRICPGNPEGTISYQIIHTLFDKVMAKANYSIDLHGGDLVEDLVPFAMYFKTGNTDLDKESEALAKALGIERLWETSETEGIWNPKGTVTAEAAKKGVVSVLAEAGGKGLLEEENVSILYNALLNAIKHLNMIKGQPTLPLKQRVTSRGSFGKAKRGGFWHPHVSAGTVVAEGDVIGEITNLQGDILETVKAPDSGELLMVVVNPAITSGDSLYLMLI